MTLARSLLSLAAAVERYSSESITMNTGGDITFLPMSMNSCLITIEDLDMLSSIESANGSSYLGRE